MARIAQFIDTRESGGAERVLVDLCARLPGLGHEIELYHFGNEWIETESRKFGGTSVVVPWESLYRSKWSVGLFALRFARLLRRRRVDLLHSHLTGAISAGSLAAVIAGVPHVGTLHDVHLVEEKPIRLLLLRVAAALGTQLVTVSQDMRRFYRERARGELVAACIYNGVDLSAFHPGPRPPGHPFTFVSVGRLAPVKAYNLLLQALALTGPAGPRLRVVGDGPDRAALERQTLELGLGGRVEFLGFRDDVAELLGAADAFVLASRSEGLSCSIMEAMAAALPCVVTEVGGNGELVIDGVTGLLAPPNDAAAMARQMTQLAKAPARAAAMGRAGRERAEREFGMEAMLRRYDDLYRSLLWSPAVRSAVRE